MIAGTGVASAGERASQPGPDLRERTRAVFVRTLSGEGAHFLWGLQGALVGLRICVCSNPTLWSLASALSTSCVPPRWGCSLPGTSFYIPFLFLLIEVLIVEPVHACLQVK